MAEKDSIVLTFDVDSDDFTRAGEASSRLKRTLKPVSYTHLMCIRDRHTRPPLQ